MIKNAILVLGCVAAHGVFGCDTGGCYTITPNGKPATAFLLELIARLQSGYLNSLSTLKPPFESGQDAMSSSKEL